MTVNAVRLNHAVLFVADLERSLAFYQQAFDMQVVAREPRANAAFLRLPRSGNHHDLGLFGVGAQPRAPARQPRALPPRVAGRHHRGARAGPAHAGGPRRLHRRVQPRRHQEHLRPRPRRQRVRGHVDAAQGQLGRVRRRRPGRPARPRRRGPHLEPAYAPPPSSSPWTGPDHLRRSVPVGNETRHPSLPLVETTTTSVWSLPCPSSAASPRPPPSPPSAPTPLAVAVAPGTRPDRRLHHRRQPHPPRLLRPPRHGHHRPRTVRRLRGHRPRRRREPRRLDASP